jgi:hypothetical protein
MSARIRRTVSLVLLVGLGLLLTTGCPATFGLDKIQGAEETAQSQGAE